MGGKGSNKPESMSANDMMRIAKVEQSMNRDMLREQTRANRPQQVTPWATTTWEEGPEGDWTQTVELTDPMQRALTGQQEIGAGRTDIARNLLERAGEEMGAPIGWDPLSMNEVMPSGEARQSAEDALYRRATSRLDPYWQQQEQATQSQLFNQGLRPGDEAYDAAMANMQRARTDAYQTAMDQSIAGGGAEMERGFGMDLKRRQQALSEALRRRGQTLDEISALTSGADVDVPDMPGFQASGRVAGADLTGAAEAGQRAAWDRYSAEQAEDQALWSGIAGLGGAIAPFFMSDRRLKSDIMHIGYTHGGQRVYEYTIFGHREIGVMAQESPPEAVRRHCSGYLMVDYSRIR